MTRRARGTGSIWQRGDGRWAAAIHDASGRRRYLYAPSRKQITAKLAEAERAIETGAPVRSDRLTVDGFLTRWLDTVAPTLRPRTLESYAETARLHLRPGLGHLPLARLSVADVQGYLNGQLATGRSAAAVKYDHAVLRAALGKAERWQVVTRNVARLAEPPTVRRPEIRPLTPTEAGQLLASVSGTQDGTLYLVALGLGMRQGELLALRWQDVDLDAGTITVAHTLQRIGGTVTLAEPKTAKSRRSLSVPAPVLASLREHRKRQLAERLAVGSAWQDGGFVFASTIGTPLEAHAVSHRLTRQLAAAGVRRVSFHSLRHAAASYLLAAGVPLRVVQEVLGHSQLSTTADIYAHVSPELQADAAARMGTLLDAIGGRPS
jgi:integrase